jgi:hypothetical protein
VGRLLVLLVLAAGLTGLLLAVSLPRGGGAPAPRGYRLRADDVRFTFRPRAWAHTTLLATGDTVPMRDLRVRRVALARPGAGGALALDPMRRDEGTWELNVPRAALGAGRVVFGFVVNDRFWAEPPPAVPNRLALPGPPPRHALTLDLPAAP